MSPRHRYVPRRRARELIARARRAEHWYKSLGAGSSKWEKTEVAPRELLDKFEANTRWRLSGDADLYHVEVPNAYAYEHYRVYA